jgi:membrane dipeptidase
MLNLGRSRVFAGSLTEYSTRAIDLVKGSTVLDMLCVMTLDFSKQDKWFKNPESFTEADLKPFKESGINVIHPAIGMGGMESYGNVLNFFAFWNGFIASHDEHFMRVDSAGDLDRVKSSG